SDNIVMLLTSSSLVQRACANGKSILTVNKLTFASSFAFSLNFFVCVEQTPVSIDGTTLINVSFSAKSFSVFSLISFATTLNEGAVSLTSSCSPSSVIGSLLYVTFTISITLLISIMRVNI